ncbi:MAG: cation transporter [Burkholderiales bacterium]|nr:cation transporter [Burkholderiales bacterium]
MRAYNRFHRHLGSGAPAGAKTSAVGFAFVGGLMVALVKTAAAVLTGSASMGAEAVHSWVASVNEGFLVAAYLAARRPADAAHPLGHGRESYVWSLFASIGMFIVGAEVGIWRGLRQLGSSEGTAHYGFGYLVIAGALAFQGLSFVQALRFVRERAAEREQGIFRHVFESSDSQLRAVVTDDFLALAGLVVAGLGMGLHQLSGRVAWDALGSILIGLLMGVAGLILVNLNRRYLAGMPIAPERAALAVRLMKQAPEIARVTYFFAEYVGPDQVLVLARVVLAGEHDQAELARILRGLEQRIMENKAVVRAVLTLALPEEEGLG